MLKRNGNSQPTNHVQDAHSPFSLAPTGFAPTRIPQPRSQPTKMSANELNSRETNILSVYVEKWKNRYEDAERKHRTCLLRSEKARREHDDLLRRHQLLAEEKQHLETEVQDRERQLNRLRKVSEQLFTEYQQLKHQSQLDNGLMQKVMQQAGAWYKQNTQLKRQSAAILNALPACPPGLDLTDALDTGSDSASNEEIEFLKRTISELSEQLATCQTDLNNVKLHEFEAHELNVNLTQELETERERNASLTRELAETREKLSSQERVGKMLVEELTALKQSADLERDNNHELRCKVEEAERRASLVVEKNAADERNDERNELNELREALARERDARLREVQDLQLRLSERHEDIDVLLWEEKIRLAEGEARDARERAERAERKLHELETRQRAERAEMTLREAETERRRDKKEVEKQEGSPTKPVNSAGGRLASRITYFESRPTEGSPERAVTLTDIMETVAPPPLPPQCGPPPPPPPPPLPSPLPLAPPTTLADRQGSLRRNKKGTSNGPAIDAIVDQIKGGKFHLKSTEIKVPAVKQSEEQPEAVKEMLAILGTLRKRRSTTRPSFVPSHTLNI